MKCLYEIIYTSVVIAVLVGVSACVSTRPVLTWDNQINSTQRFKILSEFNNEAVFDRETGLVWEKSPKTSFHPFIDARNSCNSLVLGNRMGWRIPKVHELTSLVDPNTNDSLPSNHPFVGVTGGGYWTGSLINVPNGNFIAAKTVFFPIITPLLGANINPSSNVEGRYWCVRAPGGAIESSEQ